MTLGHENPETAKFCSECGAAFHQAGKIENAEGHRVPLEQALRIADQVCQALEHAYAHGVVHRDPIDHRPGGA